MPSVRALTHGPAHHFFGYYGINPWDKAQRTHLALETDFHDHAPEPGEEARVGLAVAATGGFQVYARTRAFNLQQGSMLHWIDAGHGEEFTFNDWEGERIVSRAVHPQSGARRTLGAAIAAVSPAGPLALGLDYARMAHCRRVVGYASSFVRDVDRTPRPEDDGLWRIDLTTGKSELALSIAELLRVAGADAPGEGLAWFNHVCFNPSGTRVLFLCRIRKPEKGWWTSLWTVNPDGSGLACQIGFAHTISHFAWCDERRILISTNVRGEMQFMRFADGRGDFEPFGNGLLPKDGHQAFSPGYRYLICDTYPNAQAQASLFLLDLQKMERVELGPFASPVPFRGDCRCDLHPRWRPDGHAVTIDSIHDGSRQIYEVDLSGLI